MYSSATFAALASSAEFLLREHGALQVLVVYASLRELVRTFLKPLGDRVTVQTIRQNKGSQAGVLLLSVQPRHAYEREPEGSMIDTGKLVVALAEHDTLLGCSLALVAKWVDPSRGPTCGIQWSTT